MNELNNVNGFSIGENVMVGEDLDHDDPVAEEYANSHARILKFYPPFVEVEFLNTDIHRVMLKNIRKCN